MPKGKGLRRTTTMKNGFHRPTSIDLNLFSEIVREMISDLKELDSGKAKEEIVIECVKTYIYAARPLNHGTGMLFWGFGDPSAMPSDARVDYFYFPSYIAVSFMARAKLEFGDKVANLPNFKSTLKKGMAGAASRSFLGHGYESYYGLLSCFEVFAIADMKRFVDLFPKICPIFTSKFYWALDCIQQGLSGGILHDEWDADYSSKAEEVLSLLMRSGK
ncbi:MAG: hypothetical protein LBU32_19780 [Clostridiales bacterium]|nr:hypothetical protein [Clostridiales bacterium]